MDKSKVFVICPFNREYDDIYLAIKQIGNRLGVSVFRPDEIIKPGNIMSQIYEALESSDVIVCDISDSIGNVMYELGYVHALRRPVIQICQKDRRIPFDIMHTRTLIYDRSKILSDLSKLLEGAISEALKDPESWTFSRKIEDDKVNRNLFISYSHKDKDCLDRLLVHLKPLEKQGLIDLWMDTKLSAGDKWKSKIEESLRKARVAILLVSADFLASDFIVDNELPPLLSAAEAVGTRIIPIVIKPCRFSRDRNLSSFQAINDPSMPIIKLDEGAQEEVYDKVSELVESYVRRK